VTAPATDARPRLRSDVVVGPPLRLGGDQVHYIRDALTGANYRIGPREHFVISRMTGDSTIDEIGHEYAQTFGRRLGEENWQRMFELLRDRQLLAGGTDDATLDQLRQDVQEHQRLARRAARGRLRLVNPDRFMGWLADRLGPLFTPWFVIPALLAIAAAEVVVFGNLGELVRDIWGPGMSVGFIIVAMACTWVVHGLHECAHGLVGKRFGGRVPEIGLLWRFPLLAPYCRVEDLMLFRGRAQRVYTAFAGTFVGLLVCVPVVVVWWFAPAGEVRRFAAVLLFVCGIGQLLNVVPFIRLDGYYMLTYALGIVDLRSETARFWKVLLRWPRRGAGAARYGWSARWLYGVYGPVSAICTGALTVILLIVWYRLLAYWAGPVFAALVVVGGFTVSGALSVRRRFRRRTPSAPSTVDAPAPGPANNERR